MTGFLFTELSLTYDTVFVSFQILYQNDLVLSDSKDQEEKVNSLKEKWVKNSQWFAEM